MLRNFKIEMKGNNVNKNITRDVQKCDSENGENKKETKWQKHKCICRKNEHSYLVTEQCYSNDYIAEKIDDVRKKGKRGI